MRTVNETFTDDEFEKLQAVKKKRSWHDFILELAKNKNKMKMWRHKPNEPKIESPEKIRLRERRKQK